MDNYNELINKKSKLAVVGLGYVGMPLAVAFAKKIDVIGFDINEEKIDLYKKGIDITNEVGNKALKESSVNFTSDEKKLEEANFFVVAVPTPVKSDTTPDLTPVIGASEVIGRNLTKGSIVVFESTVYPGVTEEVCLPILENESGLKCGQDFKIGYSPERINPGDKVNTIEKIIKIVSGMDKETLDEVAKTYELIIEAGVHRAPTIKVAEAAKVIENSQRDINIAFMNELSIMFDKMGINTADVINAASTKWNFIKFYPGLVGGHCIGVDPYYLTYRAAQLGFDSKVVSAGRKINDGMPKFVVEKVVKSLIASEKLVKGAKIGLLGVTFKENCPDVRNSKVIDIIKGLEEYGINVIPVDPVADKEDLKRIYKLELKSYNDLKEIDGLIVAVKHKEFEELGNEEIHHLFNHTKTDLIFDLKGIFREKINKDDFYWSL